jgi:hypothetical protein
VNESRPQEANESDVQELDEARAQAILEEIAAGPLEERADAVEALVARLESELDATSDSSSPSGS